MHSDSHEREEDPVFKHCFTRTGSVTLIKEAFSASGRSVKDMKKRLFNDYGDSGRKVGERSEDFITGFKTEPESLGSGSYKRIFKETGINPSDAIWMIDSDELSPIFCDHLKESGVGTYNGGEPTPYVMDMLFHDALEETSFTKEVLQEISKKMEKQSALPEEIYSLFVHLPYSAIFESVGYREMANTFCYQFLINRDRYTDKVSDYNKFFGEMYAASRVNLSNKFTDDSDPVFGDFKDPVYRRYLAHICKTKRIYKLLTQSVFDINGALVSDIENFKSRGFNEKNLASVFKTLNLGGRMAELSKDNYQTFRAIVLMDQLAEGFNKKGIDESVKAIAMLALHHLAFAFCAFRCHIMIRRFSVLASFNHIACWTACAYTMLFMGYMGNSPELTSEKIESLEMSLSKLRNHYAELHNYDSIDGLLDATIEMAEGAIAVSHKSVLPG